MNNKKESTVVTDNEQPTQEIAETQINNGEAAGYLADLEDPDEVVRTRAAQALHKMGHPRALEACLRTLNDAPDLLHLDMTPAVWCLRDIGQPALLPLFDRLESDDRMTRLRAERAVTWITKYDFGFNGQEWASDGLEQWMNWWDEIGYDSDASASERHKAVDRLRAWLAAH